MSKKKLLAINLNEYNLNFLNYGAKKYDCYNIKELNIKTIYNNNNKSSLSPIKTILPFLLKHFRNYIFRVMYRHEKDRN